MGGGVPRNWAQQVAPYLDLLHTRLKLDLPEVRFHYGVRLCPEPAHWGGLSGCTFKEGVSWGKFVSPEDGGRYAEVLCDATIAWPLLLKGVSQRLGKDVNRLTETRKTLLGRTGTQGRNADDNHHKKQRGPQRQPRGIDPRDALHIFYVVHCPPCSSVIFPYHIAEGFGRQLGISLFLRGRILNIASGEGKRVGVAGLIPGLQSKSIFCSRRL